MFTACPKKLHSNISLDHLLLWLQCTFAMALFQQLYAMSQYLFPSRVALIFGQVFVLMTGESNHSFSLFQYIPKTFNWVRTLWWPIHVWKWLLMLPDTRVLMRHSFITRARLILALSSWNMPEQSGKRNSIDGITWSFITFRNSTDLPCPDLPNWSNYRS